MVGKATQFSKTIAYLDTNHTETVRELFGVGINSPTKRISELNDMGECIKSMWDSNTNKEGA
jgi:hypothetical protein